MYKEEIFKVLQNYNFWSVIVGAIAAIGAVIAVIATVAIHRGEVSAQKKNAILSRYEALYTEVFSLRKDISKLLGFQWYYEATPLLKNTEAQEKLINHLNKICNLFVSFMDSRSAKKLWLQLMPIKLFLRLYALYPSVIQMQNASGDTKLFAAYENMITLCRCSKKFKKLFFSQRVTWVGIRKSDTFYSSKSVNDIISVFGENDKSIRPNQNVGDVYSPLIDKIYQKLNKKSKQKLMFYNAKLSYALKDNYRKNVVAANKDEVLLHFNDKLQTRIEFAAKNIKCISSMVVNSLEIDFLKLCNEFNTDKLIAQKVSGGGGYGTYLITKENYKQILPQLRGLTTSLLISPYLTPSISVNVHILICEKQTVVFPGSIQIIEEHNNQLLYRGADFISFREFDGDIKKEIQLMASKSANILRAAGYRGIAGIDMLVFDHQVLFLEVNPRFQASSYLLDKYMNEKHFKLKNNKQNFAGNLVELNANAFNGIGNTSVTFLDEINYSCYFYYADNADQEQINYKLHLLKKSGIHVDTDGYFYGTEINNYSYLYRATFNEKISQISPDGDLWVSDNIKFAPEPVERLQLKIALLNQGVRLDNICIDKSKNRAVFDAVDFYIDNFNFHVNSPIDTKLISISPFEIKNSEETGSPCLYFYNKLISPITIETNIQPEASKALFFSTDRLRISPARGCQFKSDRLGCAFCNVPPFMAEYSFEELKKAYDYGIIFKPRHILIGGGTIKKLDNADKIIKLTEYIRSTNPEIEISLMSIPPKVEDLNRFKNAGITDVSFNIEIFNEDLAKSLMPAKSEYARSYYFDILKQSVSIWNNYGDVRSIVIVGLDSTEDLKNGIMEFKKLNIQPVLSVFRPLRGANMFNRLPPTNDYLNSVYEIANQILGKNGQLGPKCEDCRNNTLSI